MFSGNLQYNNTSLRRRCKAPLCNYYITGIYATHENAVSVKLFNLLPYITKQTGLTRDDNLTVEKKAKWPTHRAQCFVLDKKSSFFCILVFYFHKESSFCHQIRRIASISLSSWNCSRRCLMEQILFRSGWHTLVGVFTVLYTFFRDMW